MAADSSLLQGEVTEDLKAEVPNAEALLRGILLALLEESKLKATQKAAQ